MQSATNNRSINGKGANFILRGEGTPVILVHGIASSLKNWRYLLPELATNDFQAYALDLMGHGESHKPAENSAYCLDGLYSHFASWVDSLDLDQSPVFVGHSMGGYLCLKYAINNPERVTRLVLVNPLYKPAQLRSPLKISLRQPEVGEHLLRLMPVWLLQAAMRWAPTTTRHVSPRMRHQVARDFKRADPRVVRIAGTIEDLSHQLGEIDHRTLLVWGDRDLTLAPASFRHLAQALPNAESHHFDGSGHTPHLTRARHFNLKVLDFLNGHTGEQAAKSNGGNTPLAERS